MKESVWGYMIIIMGVITISLIFFFQRTTNTEENNYTVLRETAEAAMYDSVDLATYKKTGEIRIVQEKFVENFLRRFADNASLAHAYKIDIYDVNESPPKVSIKVTTSDDTANFTNEVITMDNVSKIDAIIESKYWKENKNE